MNIMRTAMLLAAMTALFMGVGFVIGGQTGMLIAFAIAAVTNFISYWNADKLALRAYNAHEVDVQSFPNFYNMIAELARNANLPMPRVYVYDSEQPNAFATGRNPENAAVAASTGLLERLNSEEVAAVMAHELAHIQNRDTLIMTMTATFAGAISMLSNFAMFFSWGRSSNNNSPFGVIGLLIAAVVAPIAAMIVQMAISRTREYSADRRGAEICGNPLWLASALAKIAGVSQQIPNYDAERNPATAHMFIINPLSGERMDNLFSTHPNTENRIAALSAMAQEFGIRSTLGTSGANAAPQNNTQPSGPWGQSNEPKGPWS